jgi:ribonuclease T2
MNPKKMIQILLVIAVVGYGAWQQFNANAPPPNAHPQHARNQSQQGQHNGAHAGQHQPAAGKVGDFDYYVASLSWSPTYCIAHANDTGQCGRGYGFVLHGLWPQRMAGGWPQDCPASDAPSASVVARALPFMPSEKLIRHEWSKHGTCSGLSAEQYFASADRVFSSVKIPAQLEQPKSTLALTSDDVLNAFRAANPTFPRESFTLNCSGNELQEVRVCLSSSLQPQACGKGVRTQCREGELRIPATR